MKVIIRSWPEFYAIRNNEEYYNYVCEKYNCFIHEVYYSIKPNDLVVEYGCGLGNISRALLKLRPKCEFLLTDINEYMLMMSKDNLYRGGLLSGIHYEYRQYDARLWPIRWKIKGQIAHSHGLLEHFPDDEINEIINLQKDNFRELIHYVPSNKYSQPSFGDERLMSPDQWFDICKPNEIIEFNNGYDLILKWKS